MYLRLRNEALEKVMKLIKYSDKDSLVNFFKTVEGFNEVDESKVSSLIDGNKIEDNFHYHLLLVL